LLAVALAAAYDRRHATMAIGGVILCVGIIALLIFKIISGGLLGEIADPVYRRAAQVVYQAFYGDLRGRLVALVVGGGILMLIALLAGPYGWATRLRTKLGLDKLKAMQPYHWATKLRRLAARYELWLDVAGTAATAIWLLALSTLTPATLVVIVSVLVTFCSLLHLICRPAPAHAAR